MCIYPSASLFAPGHVPSNWRAPGATDFSGVALPSVAGTFRRGPSIVISSPSSTAPANQQQWGAPHGDEKQHVSIERAGERSPTFMVFPRPPTSGSRAGSQAYAESVSAYDADDNDEKKEWWSHGY